MGAGYRGKGYLSGRGLGQRKGTCAGVPILSQLVALAAVALVGAIDVGTLLAAALGLTLVHICGETSWWSQWNPPNPEMRPRVQTHLEPFLERTLVPASLWG